MSEHSLTALATLIAERDGLDATQAEEVHNRLRRLRDQRAIKTIEGTGGKGRGKSAMLTYEDAARALILETLAPLNLAREATDKALAAFDLHDMSLPGAKKSGLIRHLPALQSALRGMARGERWSLYFTLLSGPNGREYSARVLPADEDQQKATQESQRIRKAQLKGDGVRILARTEFHLEEILAPLIAAEKAK